MGKYICVNCHATFDTPARDTYAGDSWDCCPECGCEDFEAAAKCKGCGAEKFYTNLVGGDYCEDCVKEAIMESGSKLVYEFLSDPDVRESFAGFLADINWRSGMRRGGQGDG